MKKFFTRNRKLIEIFLSLGFVFLIGAYYYLIYIPGRENEIIARRFRTMQRIERNMKEKFDVYMQAMKDCISAADQPSFKEIIKGYNSDSAKFYIKISGPTIESSFPSLDSLKKSLYNDSIAISQNIGSRHGGKKLIVNRECYKLLKNGSIKHISAEAEIDYSFFVQPLLKKGVFDQYIVFYIDSNASNTVYETFQSGISFKGLDSLFDTKTKIYTSKIVNIKTGGESYLAFIHPCGYKDKNDRIIAGLLKKENFDRESRELPESMVTTLLFIALFTLLLFPVIRLAIMGKKERIRYVHLFATYISFLLLIPVVVLFFISNNSGFLKTNNAKENSKKILADQISQSLHYEIKSAYNLLNKFDSIYSSESILDSVNIKYLGGNAVVDYVNTTDSINAALDSLKAYLKLNPVRYQNAKRLMWLDSLGTTTAIWAFDTDPPRANYKERKYFQNVQANNLISLDGDPAKNIAIDPVISRTDGNFKVAVSKKSINPFKQLVAAVFSRFSSVTNPILPPGFEFSIIDQEGNTIFDSDTTENLNENLLNEFIDSTPLKIALNTKTLAEFKTRHEDKDYDVLVEPISWLPYYIVILEGSAFNSTLYTQSLSFTVVMMFSLFVFLCLEILIILLAHYQPSKLQNNNIDFSWIYPRTHMSYKYFALFLFNTSALIVLTLFCFINFSIERLIAYLFLFIVAILASKIFDFLLRARSVTDQQSITGQKRLMNRKYSVVFLSILLIIAIINSYFFQVLISTLLFFSILICLGFLIFRHWSKKLKGNTKNYMVNFRLMIFSRLLLISGLPVIVFFNSIYNFEQRLEQRVKLLDYANNIELSTKKGANLGDIIDQLNNKDSLRSFYTDGGWIKKIDKVANIDKSESYNSNDSNDINLLTTSRLHTNDHLSGIESFDMIEPFGADSSLFAFNNILRDSVDRLTYKITKVSNDKAKQQFISLQSGTFKYTFPSINSREGFVFWLLLFGSLALCYLLLIYVTNKIFGINLPDTKGSNLIPEKVLMDEEVRYLFVQGTPNADKTLFLKNHFPNYSPAQNDLKTSFFYLNEIPDETQMAEEKKAYEKNLVTNSVPKENWFYKILKLENKNIENIVFTHFEYNIFDEHTNRVKLNLVEKMIHLDKKRIIISSDIDPIEYFNSLKKFDNKYSGCGDKKNDSQKNNTNMGNGIEAGVPFFEYVDRWNRLLGRFTNIYIYNNGATSKNPIMAIKNPSDEFLQHECGNPSLVKLFSSQFNTSPVTKKNEEDYLLKLQSLNDHSYRHIWASCTKEEQLTLYDLAEDGLVNSNNYISLTRLLNKGLIKKDNDGVLSVINRSFRNFILSDVDGDEVKSIESEISAGHTWNDYKYPILIILGAVLYFVLSSNPEKFGNVLPMISAMMAGIPTILKLLSFLKPGAAKD